MHIKGNEVGLLNCLIIHPCYNAVSVDYDVTLLTVPGWTNSVSFVVTRSNDLLLIVDLNVDNALLHNKSVKLVMTRRLVGLDPA